MELNDDEQTNQIPKRVINFDDINNDDQPPGDTLSQYRTPIQIFINLGLLLQPNFMIILLILSMEASASLNYFIKRAEGGKKRRKATVP